MLDVVFFVDRSLLMGARMGNQVVRWRSPKYIGNNFKISSWSGISMYHQPEETLDTLKILYFHIKLI